MDFGGRYLFGAKRADVWAALNDPAVLKASIPGCETLDKLSDTELKATASVNIYGVFAVRGIKIMEGSKGLFISMPSYKAGNGEYKDICFPCTKESKAEFDKAVIGAYQQTLTQGQAAAQKQESSELQQEQSQPVMGGM